MTGQDVMRAAVAGGAAMIVGAVAVVFVIYLVQALSGPQAGRLLVRHVAEVSLGFGVFVAAVGIGVWDTYGTAGGPPMSRLVAYLCGEVLVLVALLDIGQHLRGKDAS